MLVYWNDIRINLKAIINQKGSLKIFWTLSYADFYWPEFHELFDPVKKLSDTQRRENVINNHHLIYLTGYSLGILKHLSNTG